jgi:hypothetical protein
MPQYKVKIKAIFNFQGVKGEKGMEVELASNHTSAANLQSSGRQEIIDAFQRKYGLTFNQAYTSNNYMDVIKI